MSASLTLFTMRPFILPIAALAAACAPDSEPTCGPAKDAVEVTMGFGDAAVRERVAELLLGLEILEAPSLTFVTCEPVSVDDGVATLYFPEDLLPAKVWQDDALDRDGTSVYGTLPEDSTGFGQYGNVFGNSAIASVRKTEDPLCITKSEAAFTVAYCD
jgi:hypothetical protein